MNLLKCLFPAVCPEIDYYLIVNTMFSFLYANAIWITAYTPFFTLHNL